MNPEINVTPGLIETLGSEEPAKRNEPANNK